MLDDLYTVVPQEKVTDLEKEQNRQLFPANLADYRLFNATYNSTATDVDLVEALKTIGISDLENGEKEKVFVLTKSAGHVGILDGVFRYGKLKGFNHFYLKGTKAGEEWTATAEFFDSIHTEKEDL